MRRSGHIACVEFEDEVEAIAAMPAAEGELWILPMTQRARVFAMAKGLNVIELRPLLTDQAHLRVLESADRLLRDFEAALGDDRAESVGIQSFSNRARFVLHQALFQADMITQAMAQRRCLGLLAMRSPFVPTDRGEVDQLRQRFLWKVVSSVGTRAEVPVRLVDLGMRDRVRPRRTWPGLATLLKWGNRFAIAQWRRGAVVAVPSLAYGMAAFSKDIRSRGGMVIVARDAMAPTWKAVAAAWWGGVSARLGIPFGRGVLRHIQGVLTIVPSDRSTASDWRRIGAVFVETLRSHEALDLAAVIAEKVLGDLLAEASRAEDLVDRYRDVLSMLSPKAIVSQGALVGNFLSLGEAGRQEHIPTVLISHGTHVPPRTKIEQLAMANHSRGLLCSGAYEITVVQSPQAEAALCSMGTKASYVRSQPIMWGRNRGRKVLARREAPVILHAGTAKPRWAWRPWWYETIEEYIAGLNDLIRAVERLDRGRLVIRYRPFPECTIEDLHASLAPSDRVMIKTDGAFGDDLAAADLLVSFSSTTIEEALHTRCPVLQYGGSGRYRHMPGLHWGERPAERSAVYSVERPEDLPAALSWILAHHHDIPLTDRELNGYVFMEGEAMTAYELADALVSPQLLRTRIQRTDPSSTTARRLEQVHVC